MRPIIAIHDIEKDEIVEREMNDKEFKIFQADSKKHQDELLAAESKLAEQKAIRESAIAKLAALGLTEAEIQALGGN